MNELQINGYIIECNNSIIEIFDENEQSVCWFEKTDIPKLILFLTENNTI